MNAMVLLSCSPFSPANSSSFILSDISKLSPFSPPFSPSYEIVSIPTMIVNAYPRDPVPQREYFPTETNYVALIPVRLSDLSHPRQFGTHVVILLTCAQHGIRVKI